MIAHWLLDEILDEPQFFFTTDSLSSGPQVVWTLGVAAGKHEEVLASVGHTNTENPDALSFLYINDNGDLLAKRMLESQPSLLENLDPFLLEAFFRLASINPDFEENRFDSPEQIMGLISILRYSDSVPSAVLPLVESYANNLLQIDFGTPAPSIAIIGDKVHAEPQYIKPQENFQLHKFSIIVTAFLSKRTGSEEWKQRTENVLEELASKAKGLDGFFDISLVLASLREFDLDDFDVSFLNSKRDLIIESLDLQNISLQDTISITNACLDISEYHDSESISNFLGSARTFFINVDNQIDIIKDPDLEAIKAKDLTPQKMFAIQDLTTIAPKVEKLLRRLNSTQEPAPVNSLEDLIQLLKKGFATEPIRFLAQMYNAEIDPMIKKQISSSVNEALATAIPSIKLQHDLESFALLDPRRVISDLTTFAEGQNFIGEATAKFFEKTKIEFSAITSETNLFDLANQLDTVHNLMWHNPDYFAFTSNGHELCKEIQTFLTNATHSAFDQAKPENTPAILLLSRLSAHTTDFRDFITKRATLQATVPANKNPIFSVLKRSTTPPDNANLAAVDKTLRGRFQR